MSDLQTTRRDPFLWIAALLIGAMLATLSIARYQGYNAGMFDLGNMAQAIWSATHGLPLLYSRPEGMAASRLAGHVELGYLAFAPLYALWPDPRMLLLAQAALFAFGSVGAYRLALRRTGNRLIARCAALIYLLYPTALTAVLFDFHADTIALPFLMLALDALDERAWRRYALLLGFALSLKFYIAACVAGIGFVAYQWGGQRRVGMITIAVALLYGLLAFFVIRPLFAEPGAGGAGGTTSRYAAFYFGALQELGPTFGDRLLNALVVFGPALLLAWRGRRWLLPGLPIAIAALLSTGPGGAYDYRYHHYGIVVPFIVAAAIEGVAHMQQASSAPNRPRRSGRNWRGDLLLTTGVTVLCAVLLVDTPLNPLFWLGGLGNGLDPSVYGIQARDAQKERFLARIPPDAPTAASTFIAAHLTNRATLYLLRYPDEANGPERLPKLLPQVDYAVADSLFDFFLPIDGGYAGGLDGDRAAIGLLLQDPNFGLINTSDGLLLFQRNAGAASLKNEIARQPDDQAPALARYGSAIELVRASAIQTEPGRLRMSFTWRLTGGFGNGQYVAVTRVRGQSERFVHLPSYALQPAWEWRAGQLFQETFEVEVPTDLAPGSYAIQTGWYDLSSPYAYATDQRSRMPNSDEVTVGSVTIQR